MVSTSNDFKFGIISWPDEAAAVISDVKSHVREILISTILPATELEVYLNCETLESKKCTIRLSSEGFQIVGDAYDKIDHLNGFPYETPYALLNVLSPGYVESFGTKLSEALQNLQQQQDTKEANNV